MTDPDTIAAFYAIRAAAADAEPAPLPPAPDDLALPPTDDDLFDGIPAALPEEITQKIERPAGRDENWEEDETTLVRRTTTLQKLDELQDSLPHETWVNLFGDPTGCMM